MGLQHFHIFLAFILFGLVLADTFYLRSERSKAIQPQELIQSWRKSVAIWEMILFIALVTLGLLRWMPNMHAYNPMVFHIKITLSVVFLLVAKIRMLKERKKGVQPLMTKIMLATLVIITALIVITNHPSFM